MHPGVANEIENQSKTRSFISRGNLPEQMLYDNAKLHVAKVDKESLLML